MKRIEFIAPVESMRGNLSGEQDLFYADNNNKAFFAPDGKNFARNYTPRFIGAKRASDGLKFFAVKTRSAVNISSKSLSVMALLAMAGEIYGQLVKDKTSSYYTKLVNLYNLTDRAENGVSMRKWAFNYIYSMLSRWDNYREIARNPLVPNFGLKIMNPFGTWTNPQEGAFVPEIAHEKIVKFWKQLHAEQEAYNGIVFNAGGLQIVALKQKAGQQPISGGGPLRWNDGYQLGFDLMNPSAVFLIDTNTEPQITYYLQKNDEYVSATEVKDGETYTLTTASPS